MNNFLATKSELHYAIKRIDKELNRSYRLQDFLRPARTPWRTAFSFYLFQLNWAATVSVVVVVVDAAAAAITFTRYIL